MKTKKKIVLYVQKGDKIITITDRYDAPRKNEVGKVIKVYRPESFDGYVDERGKLPSYVDVKFELTGMIDGWLLYADKFAHYDGPITKVELRKAIPYPTHKQLKAFFNVS